MYKKSLLIWLSIIILIDVNGLFRQLVLEYYIRETFLHLVSVIILCFLIFTVSYIFVPKLGKGTNKNYIKMGLLWYSCTIISGTIFALITRATFNELLEMYNITKGNLWLIVDLFIGFIPWLIAKIKRII